MLRNFLIAVFVLGLSVNAFAVEDDVDDPQSILVQLTIGGYAQVWYQDDEWGHTSGGNDLDIIFSDVVGEDYWRGAGVIGAYSATTAETGTAADATSSGYYESFDGATIWMQANIGISGNLCTSGNLHTADHELPTWYTIAVTGYDPDTDAPDPNGFRLGNSGSMTGWVNDGVVPFASEGGYAGDGTPGGQDVDASAFPLTYQFGAQDFHPNQDAFQFGTVADPICDGSFDLQAPVGPGTMKFLARVQRDGLNDPSGVYETYIHVAFAPNP